MAAQQNQSKRAWIGLGIIAGLFAVAVFIFLLAHVRRALEPSATVVALMPAAPKVRVGTPVWIAGKPVGEVTAIHVREPQVAAFERIALRLEVPAEYWSQIRTDSYVRLATGRLIGEPVVDILPGSPGNRQLSDMDSLRSRPGVRRAEFEKQLLEFRVGFDSLRAAAEALRRPLKARVGRLARLERQVRVVQRQFFELTNTVREGPLASLADPAWTAAFERVLLTLDQVATEFTRAGEMHSARSREAGEAFHRLSARAKLVSEQIRHLQQTMVRNQGTLYRIQSDSALNSALHGVTAHLDTLIAETKRNPLRYWF